ncbi:MAG: hypothetical protein LBC64_02035 [Fibromonadaceae bacterium]|jgi:uncharacterized protein (TIGR02145 family)|nr:hypothetical protein [Fibromonadaceae bacterium]
MRTQLTKIVLAASIGLALIFTLSCSGKESVSGVVIGSKTWTTKNLDINVPGSKCYGEGNESLALSEAEVQANCAKYGRLYDWATAMALPSKCNSTLSTKDEECTVTTPYHRGICPEGWHVPNNAEWDDLYRIADGTNGTNGPYDSHTAGRYLKAKEGWENCGPLGSGRSYMCEDTKGFAALPGGSGNSNGNFSDIGRRGYWWGSSASEANYAYFRETDYSGEGARWHNNSKKSLYSVRCVKD